MANRMITAALLTILAACDPGEQVCEPLECTDDGRCWAALDWPLRPEAIAAADLELAIGDELELDGECYSVKGTDAHVCIVDVGCALLIGRPAGEVAMGPECAPAGPWSVSGVDGAGECWAVVAGVAVVVVP